MNRILSKIWNSASARNVGKLLSANIIAQAIGLLIYPVLTRMYAPEDFALLSLFASITGIAVLVSTGEYQYAIVLPKEDRHARALVQLGMMLIGMTVGVLCLSIPFSEQIAGLFEAPSLARYWWMMPLSVAVMGAWNILNYWYIRRKAFSRVSGYQITQSVFSASGKVVFGSFGWLHGGMIIATVLAPLFSLLVSIALAWKNYIRELLKVDMLQIREVAQQYGNFPKFNLPRAMVNSVGQSLPLWLLTPAFGLEQMGQLSLALTAAFVPLNILARACYQVLFQRVSELVQAHQSIRFVLLRFLLWMSAVLLIVMAVVYVTVPQLVTVLFGVQWLDSATIIRRMFPYLLLMPVCGTICFLSDVFDKQKIALCLETSYTIILALALATSAHWGTFMCSISVYGWVGFGYLLVQLLWFIMLVRQYQKTL